MYKMYKKYCIKIQNNIMKYYSVRHYLINPVYLLHDLIYDSFSLHKGSGIISLGGICKKFPKDDHIKEYMFSLIIRSMIPFQGMQGQIFENFLLAIFIAPGNSYLFGLEKLNTWALHCTEILYNYITLPSVHFSFLSP